jgi:hypothetical protein
MKFFILMLRCASAFTLALLCMPLMPFAPKLALYFAMTFQDLANNLERYNKENADERSE